jgi:hypothetical protein
MDMVSEVLEVLQNYVFPTESSSPACGIRGINEAAALGRVARSARCPEALFPLTDAGIERFLKDWKAAKA